MGRPRGSEKQRVTVSLTTPAAEYFKSKAGRNTLGSFLSAALERRAATAMKNAERRVKRDTKSDE